ncbi:hypothetical protein OOZ15_10355 [Galbibacter sp. EGI 63066]|uniref:hypothetical protein n=1 Tax=Galbibacter sp. EGI 63066 TaxID=2993559 RepID=UPI002248CEB4|nr:hypothetical protein [Galbibacter sp. EGI 63066]MCX2680342.1 hypothetical protein [Galbibacter sp. EGI 63066]
MKKLIQIYIVSFTFLFISCADIIEVQDISNEKVNLIAPAEGTVVKGNVVNFTWEPLPDADRYLLQVATPDFSSATQVLVDSLVNGTSYSKELLPNMYEWRVKGVNSAYETGFSSNVFSLQTSDGFEGNTIILDAPKNNVATNEGGITFSWETVEGAVEYQVQVIDNNDTVVNDEQTAENSIELTLQEGVFTWQVRAKNEDGINTLYNSRKITVDLTKPNTPALETPADEATEASGTEITFTWSREDIPGSAEKDSIYIYNDETQSDLNEKGLGSEKSFNTTLEAGNYYWKVRSFDAAGNVSDDSNVFELSIN